MARKQISYGARGDDVKELQTALNKNGYNLSVDGIFGSDTRSAVKDYQTKNKLQVDGIVGTNTWGSLFPTTTATKPAATTTNTTTNSAKETGKDTTAPTTPQKSVFKEALESVPKFEYGEYKESDLVAQAKAALQAQLANKPGAYQSPYQQQISETLDKILNREKFSYDLNGDALYQQYKDQYTTQGKQAMMDTMGQAAALTGGYGNSYAQSVGQQTYQGYLQQLNDKVPELYQLALDQYNREGDDLLNQYSLYVDRENTEYGRHRDTVGDYYADLDYLTNQYQNERNFDYGKYSDDRNMAYQTNRDQFSDQKWMTESEEALRQYAEQLAYQKERDQAADSQWQTEFDEAMRRWNLANGLNADGTAKTSTSSGSSPRKKNDEKTENYSPGSSFMDSVIDASANSKLATSYSENKNAQLKAKNGGKSYYGEVLQEVSTNDNANTSKSYINDLYKNSYINEAEKNSLLQYVDMKEKGKK